MRKFFFLFISISLVFAYGCVPEVYKFDKEFGHAGSKKGDFLGPVDIALNDSGDLIVADAGNNRFQSLSVVDGSAKVVGGEYGTTGFKVQGISGIGVNNLTGDVYLCDYRGGKIVKYNKSGTPIFKFTDRIGKPMDVACDRAGNVYVVLKGEPGILKFNMGGRFLEKIGGTGKSVLIRPSSIFIRKEFIYVADLGGARVLKMDMTGDVKLEITQKGEYEPIKGPSSVFVDSKENIFVVDLGIVPVAMFDADGKFISKIGNLGEDSGNFVYPRGIAVGEEGNVYVIDNSRNVFLMFKLTPK